MFFIPHPDELEDRLVHEPPNGGASSQVEAGKVSANELEGQGEPGHQVLMANTQAGNYGLGVCALALDPLRLFVEEFVGDVVGVVLVQQLALLLLEASQHALAAVNLLLAGGRQFGELLLNGSLDSLLVRQTQVDGAVVLLNGGLNCLDPLVALWAVTPLMRGANEILIDPTVALVARERQAVAAMVAED